MAEFRSCIYLHSIRTIKRGSIKIVRNVSARGISKLKLRSLVDIYNQEDNKDDEPVPSVVMDLENGSDTRQGSRMFGSDVIVGRDPDVLNISLAEFMEKTLAQIREEYKEKKRKRGKKKETEAVSQVRVTLENLSLQNEDEGCDLDEPLSSLIAKLSKRRKTNQKPETKCGFTSTPSSREKGLDLPEAWDDSCSVTETMTSVSTDSSLDCDKEAESTTNTELVEEIMHDLPSDTDTRLVLHCSPEQNLPETVATEELISTKLIESAFKESETTSSTELVEEIMHDLSDDTRLVLYCSPEGMISTEAPKSTDLIENAFKEASEEFYDVRHASCCLADNNALDKQEDDLHDSVSREETELEVPQNSENEIIDSLEDPIASITDSRCDEVKDDEENNDSEPNLDKTITCMEFGKIETTDYSVLPIMDFGVEETETVWETKGVSKGYLPQTTDIVQLDYLHSLPDDTTISLQEDQLPERLQDQPATSEHVDETEDKRSQELCNKPEGVTVAAETQQQKLQNQPGKLLSGRTAISPISQAILCKAMKQPDTPEKRNKKTRGKLYFSSQHSHRILKAQGMDNIDIVKVNLTSKPTIIRKDIPRKTKCQRATTQKLPRRVNRAAKTLPFSTGHASLQGCTQKAIEFSQGQMREFQHVAANLTKELNSLRQITERCLLAESRISNTPECNLNEVKALIKNAEQTDKTSKKRLSVIERDCNRFCKLMGMVKEDSPVAENIVEKKKKVRFADDEGGDLCHVKVFHVDSKSES